MLAQLPVAVRIKPLGAGGGGVEADKPEQARGYKLLDWDKNQEMNIQTPAGNVRTFSFSDCVIGPDASQVDVFAAVGEPMIDDFINGKNANLLAHGHTSDRHQATAHYMRGGRGQHHDHVLLCARDARHWHEQLLVQVSRRGHPHLDAAGGCERGWGEQCLDTSGECCE
jgi:hypothetical protein